MPHSPSAAGFIRNQLLDSTDSGVTDQHWCDGIKHKSPRICRGKKKGKYWYSTKMTREAGLIFCGPVEVLLLVFLEYIVHLIFIQVYEALRSSAVVVYIMLTALYLIPIWTYSGINVTRLALFSETRWILDLLFPFKNFRLTKSYQNKKSKSLLLLPTVPVFLSFLSGLGIILPCAGIFVEVSANKKTFFKKS